jgi:tRNA(fMet)-specific endonuclease VapC
MPDRYILDTNTISDILRGDNRVTLKLREYVGQQIYICQPVQYEVMRGLIHRKASNQLGLLETLSEQLLRLELTNDDWDYAANLWAITRTQGLQFSDVDLLLCALAYRIDGVIVTSDEDFSRIDVATVNWRNP